MFESDPAGPKNADIGTPGQWRDEYGTAPPSSRKTTVC